MNNKEIEIKIEIDENKYNTLLNDLTKVNKLVDRETSL